MKGAVSTIVLVSIAIVVVAAILYGYSNSQSPSEKSVTGRAVGSGSTEVSLLGLLESCNPNKDRCQPGLVCKLATDNIYRCLR